MITHFIFLTALALFGNTTSVRAADKMKFFVDFKITDCNPIARCAHEFKSLKAQDLVLKKTEMDSAQIGLWTETYSSNNKTYSIEFELVQSKVSKKESKGAVGTLSITQINPHDGSSNRQLAITSFFIADIAQWKSYVILGGEVIDRSRPAVMISSSHQP